MPRATFAFAVPRGQRFDDTQGVPDTLRVWRGLDPVRAWNAANYNLLSPSNSVHYAALRTEELSTAASDCTTLPALRTRFPNWKMATFTIGQARAAGYVAMRDPTNVEDVVLYSRADPDNTAPKSVAKALAAVAQIV